MKSRGRAKSQGEGGNVQGLWGQNGTAKTVARGEISGVGTLLLILILPGSNPSGTPKKWRKYLILGINDWQKAFEKAGFKNAIMGKEWPENDSTMSMEDARYCCRARSRCHWPAH